MPIYATKCAVCDARQDVYRTIAKYKDLPECCGQMVDRVIVAPMVIADCTPFKSIVDGSIVNSNAGRREHMKKHGLIELGNEPIKKQEYRGDHNVRKELTQAVRQVLSK
jgi:hypothetical protein